MKVMLKKHELIFAGPPYSNVINFVVCVDNHVFFQCTHSNNAKCAIVSQFFTSALPGGYSFGRLVKK